MSTAAKAFEAAEAIRDGADEIDMVIHIGQLKAGNTDYVLEDIKAVKAAIGDHILKVIIETCLLTEEEKITMCRLVTESGAEYIKTDYNQDAGVGTERDAASFGEGLELCAKAYLGWVDEMRARFPQVLFETCASGGLRMDHETLQHFSIVSTSDQTDYKKYPYIAGNILSAALPAPAAVWGYPAGSDTAPSGVFGPTRAWVEENITEEQVVMNMVNALLGRMHLASRIGLLSAEKFALVQEGVAYYKTLSKAKKEALPVFPLGFTSFGEKQVAAGFEAQGKVYLAVWNLGGGNTLRLPLRAPVTEVRVAYPQAGPVRVRAAGTALEVASTKPFQACFLEAER